MSAKTMSIGKHLLYSARKYGAEILTGIGITGMVTTVVIAVKATPKALECIDEKKAETKTEKLTINETIAATWTCYIPATVTGIVSIGCLIGANSIHVRTRTALATAYALSESAMMEYQDKVVETIGKKKEQCIRDDLAGDKIAQNPSSNCEVYLTEKGNTLCYDVVSARYFKSDIEKIRKIENELNRRMRDEMFVSLNEFYYELGLTPSSIGDELGWDIGSGYIDLQFSSKLDNNGNPCLVIGYRVAPHYDYRS